MNKMDLVLSLIILQNQKRNTMIEHIELSDLDLRYESYRLRSKKEEQHLINSVLNHGIRDPLQGVATEDGAKILLNGFKRVRCARKLNIEIVPWSSLGQDEAVGIVELLRRSTDKHLTILEQARLVDELQGVHAMSTADIALMVEKSKAWVSVRTGIMDGMSECVKSAIFNGLFPAYAYLYVLRPFIRINAVTQKEVTAFVTAVSGMDLSIRDIRTLAQGYFKGSDELRRQITEGNIPWCLKQLKETIKLESGCTGEEQRTLADLGRVLRTMRRITVNSYDNRLQSGAFFAQANLLTKDLMDQVTPFEQAIRTLHDRSGQTSGNLLPA
jgi:hypothetical protein